MHGIIETFLLAMTPIGELRVAIPVGLTVYKLNWLLVYIIAVLGNSVPAVLLLLFLRPTASWLSRKSKAFERFLNWRLKKTKERTKQQIRKHGAVGLMLFVAMPLPITGAWTGSLAAYLFNIPFKKSFPAVLFGILFAGVIVSIAAQAGVSIEKYFGWITLVGIIVISAIGIIFLKLKHWKLFRN